MKFIDSAHSQLLANAMDAYTLRHRISASNIANIDTPGFNKHQVDFEQELQKAQKAGNTENMNQVRPSITITDSAPVLEDELLEMSDTQMRVDLVTRSLRHHFEMLRTGITGINR